MNETVFLGACPVIRPEGIYLDGQRVIRLGLLGDAGDLFAYRRMWEPFIAAHLELWRAMNERFEDSPDVRRCPSGIFKNSDIKDPDPVWRSWCAALALTRMQTSVTDPAGILPRWNAWKDKTSAQILAGATDMLKWQQDVVLQVGGPDKDKLLQIAKAWGIDVKLPDLPPFSTQQEIISRLEGAYSSTKGLLRLLGYGAGETVLTASDVTQAVAQGLSDTAKAVPGVIGNPLTWLGVTAILVLVGGALLVYYVPRRSPEQSPAPI